MPKRIVLSKDGKVVSFEVDREDGRRVGKSLLGAGTVDYAAKNLKGYRVTVTTNPRNLVKKEKFRDNIRKRSLETLGRMPIMFPVTSTGLLVLEYKDNTDEEKIVDVLTKAIQDTKFQGFWIF
jgi:hypothetical protein